MNSALMLHRHARPAVAGSYTIGAILGASATASAAFVMSGLLSPISANARGVVAVCLLVLLGLHAVGFLCLDLPERSHQIPRETFTASPTRAAFRFAFELGTGVRTYITAASPYGLAVILLLALPDDLGSAAAAAGAAAVGYGVGRSLVVASQSVRKTVAVDHPHGWLRAADLLAIATAFAVAIVKLSGAAW